MRTPGLPAPPPCTQPFHGSQGCGTLGRPSGHDGTVSSTDIFSTSWARATGSKRARREAGWDQQASDGAPGHPPPDTTRKGAGAPSARTRTADLPALGAELLGVFTFLSMPLSNIYVFTKNVYYICNWEKSRPI